MFTILLGIITAAAVFSAVDLSTDLSKGWSIFFAVLGFVAVQVAVSLILRSRMKRINSDLQQVMMATRKNLERKQQLFIRQRNTNQTMMRIQLEAEQKKGIEDALAVCEQFRPLCRWNMMMKKQIATMQMAFHFQMRNWEEVDKLLPDCMYIDPQTVSMRLARMYKTKSADLDKFYKKRSRWMRKDSCVLPAAVYSWILLKLGRKEDALKALNEALKKSDNAVLTRNRDAIVNDKLKQFSNADLAESWYVLALEEPKMQKIQQRAVYR
jgi:tetratricopeptide (TPR) repeat protein